MGLEVYSTVTLISLYLDCACAKTSTFSVSRRWMEAGALDDCCGMSRTRAGD